MEQLKKSKGSEAMKKITEAYNTYSASVRVATRHLERLKKLMAQFPKNERPLHEEKLLKYKQRIHEKTI